VQSPCNSLIEDYTWIFYKIDEGNILSIQCTISLRGPKSMRKVDGLSHIFIDFYVPALTLSCKLKLRLKLKLCYDRGQSASLSWNKAPIWGLRPDFYYCQTVAGLLMWGAFCDENGSAVYNSCWSSPAQPFLGTSPVGLVTIFYCLRFETPPT
jgi:hypothetical protein